MPKRNDRAAKVPKTVYLSRDIAKRLEQAAKAEGMSGSVYVEQTLRARFKKESVE